MANDKSKKRFDQLLQAMVTQPITAAVLPKVAALSSLREPHDDVRA
jgi:hypothetical protein